MNALLCPPPFLVFSAMLRRFGYSNVCRFSAAVRARRNRCNSSVRRISSLKAFILSCTSWMAISAILIFNRFSSACNQPNDKRLVPLRCSCVQFPRLKFPSTYFELLQKQPVLQSTTIIREKHVALSEALVPSSCRVFRADTTDLVLVALRRDQVAIFLRRFFHFLIARWIVVRVAFQRTVYLAVCKNISFSSDPRHRQSTHRFPFSLSYLHSFPSNAFDRFYFPLNCGDNRMASRVHHRSWREFFSNWTSRLAASAVRSTQHPLKCKKTLDMLTVVSK